MLLLMASTRCTVFIVLSLCCTTLVFTLSSEPDALLDQFLNPSEFDENEDDIFYEDFFDHVDSEPSTQRVYNGNSKESSQVNEFIGNLKYLVHCGEDAMRVILPLVKPSEVTIFGLTVMNPVWKACGYSLTKLQGKIVLYVSYSGCHVTKEDGRYTLPVTYRDNSGQTVVASLSCPANSSHMASPKMHRPQSDQHSFKCVLPPPTPALFQDPVPTMPSTVPSTMPSTTQTTVFGPHWLYPQHRVHKQTGCNIPDAQKLPCGPTGVTHTECLKKGCCMDMQTSTCYYSMDECTADGQFVFAIPAEFSNVVMDPLRLVVAAKKPCKPIIANDNFAVFKFSVTECGTRSYQIGDTRFYMAEVRVMKRMLDLKYGVIFRDQPIRVMVECRFSKRKASFPTVAHASAGYMVMSTSLPGLVRSRGLFGVQLRIAEDSTFSKFYPQSHQPLRVLLGKPVYLELQLISPNPQGTLLVHYCLAYPRSAKSALVLLYEGCPNPLDADNISILHMANLPQNRHKRRFMVNAFQFMDQSTNKYLDEEIYFMCSTEVCLQSDTPCTETCFDQK